MIRTELFIDLNKSPKTALVKSITNSSPVSFPAVIFGDDINLTLRFVSDGQLDTTYLTNEYDVKAAIGNAGGSALALQDTFTLSGSYGWSAVLDTNTTELSQSLSTTDSYTNFLFEIELTNLSSSDTFTPLQVPVSVYKPVSKTTPTPLPTSSYYTTSEINALISSSLSTLVSASYAGTASYANPAAGWFNQSGVIYTTNPNFRVSLNSGGAPTGSLDAYKGSGNWTGRFGTKAGTTNFNIISEYGLPSYLTFMGFNTGSEVNLARIFMDDTDMAFYNYAEGGKTSFYVTSQSANVEAFIIKNSGKIGIGVSDPQTELHVDGIVSASAFYGSVLTASYALTGPAAEISVSASFASSSISASIATYAPSSSYAFSSDNVNITSTEEDTTHYLTFVTDTSGDESILVDSDLTYNPSTQTLLGYNAIFLYSVNAVSFTGSLNGNASTATYAIDAGHANTSSRVELVEFGDLETDIIHSFDLLNGCTLDTIRVDIESNGTTVSASIEKSGSGDIRFFFSDGVYLYDSTPKSYIQLTAGTNSEPVENYIYVDQADKTLKASTTSWPSTEHSPIATAIIPSAAYVQASGSYKVHVWTDHVHKETGNGHLSHLNYWIRQQNATWVSGVEVTPSVAEDTFVSNIYLSTTAGTVLQLHPHSFPAFPGTSSMLVYNDPDVNYTPVTSINTTSFDKLADGSSIGNGYYTLVLWGVVSEDDEDCKLMFNLPNGKYNTATDALDDISGYNVYDIPGAFVGTGFLIAKITLQALAGNIKILTDGVVDLRGTVSGVGGASTTTTDTHFSDGLFQIYDSADDSKIIVFEASQITTGNTRTITMADRDIDLGNITASIATSASYSNTSSWANNAKTASYYNGAVVSSSYAFSSSHALNADNAITSAFASEADHASSADDATSADSATYATTAGLANTASYYGGNVISSSYSETASYSDYALLAQNVVGGAIVETASHATYAETAGTSITAQTASYIGNGTDNNVPRWNNNTLIASSIWDTGAKVSIGSMQDNGKLNVASSLVPYISIQNTAETTASNAFQSYLSFNDSGSIQAGFVGFESAANNTLYVNNDIGDVAIMPSNTGVGIDTNSPDYKLHVMGVDNDDCVIASEQTTNGFLASFGTAGTSNAFPRAVFRIGSTTTPSNVGFWVVPTGVGLVQKRAFLECLTNEDTSTSDTKRLMMSVEPTLAYIQTSEGTGTTGGTDLIVRTRQNTNQLYLSTTGNVGINTATPSSFRLQVAGDVGPSSDDTYDLGSVALKWKSLYVNNITASLYGSASHALNADYSLTASLLLGSVESASYAVYSDTASYYGGSVISSSYSETASYSDYALLAQNVVGGAIVETASHATYAETAGTTITANTASYYNGTVETASYSYTSSWALNWDSSSILTLINAKQDTLVVGNTYSITSSWALDTISSSHALNADYALLAGTADTASYYNGSVTSASYSETSSYSDYAVLAQNVVGGAIVETASHATYAETAGSSTSSTTADTASYIGNGTNNNVPRWNNNTLIASSIWDTGAKVSIGSMQDNGKLNVASSLVPYISIQNTAETTASNAFQSYVSFNDSGSIQAGFVGFESATDNHLHISNNIGEVRFSPNSNVVSEADILPSSDNTYDLGSTSNKWQSIHATNITASVKTDTIKFSVATLDDINNGSLTPGTHSVDVCASSSFQAAFVDYVVYQANNRRAGTMAITWAGSTVYHSETSTVDVGDTSDITLGAKVNGTNIAVSVSNDGANTWVIQGQTRYL